jgi:hypothetical protein
MSCSARCALLLRLEEHVSNGIDTTGEHRLARETCTNLLCTVVQQETLEKEPSTCTPVLLRCETTQPGWLALFSSCVVASRPHKHKVERGIMEEPLTVQRSRSGVEPYPGWNGRCIGEMPDQREYFLDSSCQTPLIMSIVSSSALPLP